MNKCLNCNTETKNKKYCSRSCANSSNNLGVRRNGSAPSDCLCCGKRTKSYKRIYCSSACQQEHKRQADFKMIFETQTLLMAQTDITANSKRFLFETRGHKCEICGISSWNGIAIGIQIHHINGKALDNQLENIQLVCPNCHSQTDTYGNKGARKSDRIWRKR